MNSSSGSENTENDRKRNVEKEGESIKGKRQRNNTDLFTFREEDGYGPDHGLTMAPRRTYIKHQEERKEIIQQIRNSRKCSLEALKQIKKADDDLTDQLNEYNEMGTEQLIDELNAQLEGLTTKGGGQKGGMIGVQPLALMILIVNDFAVETFEKVLDMSVRMVNLMSNNEGCLQDYLNMVLGNTLTQLFEGALFLQVLIRSPAMLPTVCSSFINILSTLQPYLLGTGSAVAQGIIGSIALTMVTYYMNIAGEGLKDAGEKVASVPENIQHVINMSAEDVKNNMKDVLKNVREYINEFTIQQQKEQQQEHDTTIINFRLGIIKVLMDKLDIEKAELQQNIDINSKMMEEGDEELETEEKSKKEELQEQYEKLNNEKISLEEELNNIEGQNNIKVAAAGEKEGGGTRKKRTSRKGKKKASKNRKTKARRARKSRKTKK